MRLESPDHVIDERVIGILCATKKEYMSFVSKLTPSEEEQRYGGFIVFEGALEQRPVVVACSGIGKVAAGAATQHILDKYHPSILIDFGAAGSLVDDLEVGDVIVAERLYQGDVGVVHGGGYGHMGAAREIDGQMVNVREYKSDPSLVKAARMVVSSNTFSGYQFSVHFKPIVTCDQVVYSREYRAELNRAYGGVAVEMEGAAVAQVASMHGCPFLVVRSISDKLDFDLEGFEKLARYLGESRAACWLRRARFSAVHPGEVLKVGSLLTGLERAYENAALVTYDVAKEFVVRSNER